MKVDFTCTQCKIQEEGNYQIDHAKRMIGRGLCYSCDTWQQRRYDKSIIVISNFYAYRFAHRDEFFDLETEVKMFNEEKPQRLRLWDLGEIPEAVRTWFPVNAKFV